MADIRNGQLVKLVSGGPLMTAVVDQAQGVSAGQLKVVCMWFDATNRLQTAAIPAACLKAD